MRKNTHDLALSWRFIFSSLRRQAPRSYAEIRADLEAALARAGGKRMSREQIRLMIEQDQIKRYGRKLTRSEVLAEIKKRLDRS
jgi:hypothetical protein